MVDLFLNDWFSTDIILLDEMEQIENLLVHEFFHNLDIDVGLYCLFMLNSLGAHISFRICHLNDIHDFKTTLNHESPQSQIRKTSSSSPHAMQRFFPLPIDGS